MKKKELIKKIAEEFDLDEIQVSEYFDNIFEALAITFAKNKNVNISEFGKFKVKAKLNDDGEKQKTVLFSPVKKFADDINYNFDELSPVQIRILSDKDKKFKIGEEEYSEDEVEEIIFIDFEDDRLTEIEEPREEILIPEETKEKIFPEEKTEKTEDEVLIPEETKQEILHEEIPKEEEKEEVEPEEEILIPEETIHEVSEEVIPEEITEESEQKIVSEEIPVESLIKEEIELTEEPEEVFIERDKIFSDLTRIRFPEIKFEYFDEKIELPEIISKDKKIISEVVTIIKPEEEKKEEILSDIPEEKEEEIISVIEEEKEEELSPEISEIIKEEEEELPPEISEIIKEEEIIEEIKGPEIIDTEEEISSIIPPELTTEEKSEEPETIKTNLELEAELLKMLDERKKILEEIKKLEEVNPDDLIDINEPKIIFSEEKPNLFEENTLDISKQNVFVDENGKVLDKLLKEFEEQEDIQKETESVEEKQKKPSEEEKINFDIKDEHINENIEDICKEKTDEDIVKDFEWKENIEEVKHTEDKGLNDLENLFGSLYSEDEGKITLPEPEEIEPQMNNPEMKIFDKLLDEPVKPEEVSEPTESNKDLKSFNEPENTFVNFKIEKTEEVEPQKDENTIPPVKKTETIKTYDDIFNLLEPNGKKKEVKPEKTVKEEPPKKFPPILKLIIPIIILIIIIFISIYLYQRLVYKPSEENPQTQLAPSDSTRTAGNDSVIYADTNKTIEAIEEDIVYDEGGFIIKESEKGFFVQFGSFDNQFELAKKIKELKEKRITPGYEEATIEGKQIYRIKIGPYKSLDEAKSIIRKL